MEDNKIKQKIDFEVSLFFDYIVNIFDLKSGDCGFDQEVIIENFKEMLIDFVNQNSKTEEDLKMLEKNALKHMKESFDEFREASMTNEPKERIKRLYVDHIVAIKDYYKIKNRLLDKMLEKTPFAKEGLK